jgi:copper ion binding protein
MENNFKEIALPVSGMTCASCAAQIERALTALPGVASAAVNPATEQATVRFTNGPVETGDLVTAVQEAGYDVPTETVDLPIGGMTCASCVAHVEGALADVPGVLSASVNLATGRAMVICITGAVSPPDLKRAVLVSGYRVVEPEENARAEHLSNETCVFTQRRPAWKLTLSVAWKWIPKRQPPSSNTKASCITSVPPAARRLSRKIPKNT